MFDRLKTKHHLLHISLNLGTVLACMTYVKRESNLQNLGKIYDSLIVVLIFLGEVLKLFLTKYFKKIEKDTIVIQKHNKKKSNSLNIGNIFKALFLQTLCTVFYGFLCIILGAPVLHSYEQTLVLAIVLTLMTVSPAVFLLGASGTLQYIFCEQSGLLYRSEELSMQLIKYNAAGAIFGAWTGSVVAPLDWDRDWQLYPIPNIVGAFVGSGLSNIYLCSKILYTTGQVYLKHKRMS